jgi:hypothetical protein
MAIRFAAVHIHFVKGVLRPHFLLKDIPKDKFQNNILLQHAAPSICRPDRCSQILPANMSFIRKYCIFAT